MSVAWSNLNWPLITIQIFETEIWNVSLLTKTGRLVLSTVLVNTVWLVSKILWCYWIAPRCCLAFRSKNNLLIHWREYHKVTLMDCSTPYVIVLFWTMTCWCIERSVIKLSIIYVWDKLDENLLQWLISCRYWFRLNYWFDLLLLADRRLSHGFNFASSRRDPIGWSRVMLRAHLVDLVLSRRGLESGKCGLISRQR